MKPFDRVADRASKIVSRAPFFSLCLTFVLGWILLGPIVGWNNDKWHLWLNSPTTSLTFLLVAILENSMRRFEKAAHVKLDRLLEEAAHGADTEQRQLRLRAAIGCERDIPA